MVSNRANILNKQSSPLFLHQAERLVGTAYEPNLPVLERIEHSMRSIVSVLGEGSTLWVNSRLLSFRRLRPKVGAPVFTYPRPLWEREKPCEQSELRIRVRGNLRILSAIGINQLDSRAAHENDDLQPTPHPNPVPLGRNIRKGGLKNA